MNWAEEQAERERLGLPALYERIGKAPTAGRITAKRRRAERARQDLRYMQLIGAYDGLGELMRSPQHQMEKRRQRVLAAQAALERMEKSCPAGSSEDRYAGRMFVKFEVAPGVREMAVVEDLY